MEMETRQTAANKAQAAQMLPSTCMLRTGRDISQTCGMAVGKAGRREGGEELVVEIERKREGEDEAQKDSGSGAGDLRERVRKCKTAEGGVRK